MEFIDEQLELRHQQDHQSDNATITTQPGSLHTASDLNKLLHIQGVRFYTDLWSEEVYFFILI